MHTDGGGKSVQMSDWMSSKWLYCYTVLSPKLVKDEHQKFTGGSTQTLPSTYMHVGQSFYSKYGLIFGGWLIHWATYKPVSMVVIWHQFLIYGTIYLQTSPSLITF